MLKEGMILKPNINNMEFYFGGKDTLLRIEQIGMGRVFCTDLNTGEYLGDIGEPNEILFYYDIVS